MMRYIVVGLSLLLVLCSSYIVYLQINNSSLKLELSRVESSLRLQNEAIDALALDYVRYSKEVYEKDKKTALRYKQIRLKDLQDCESKFGEIEKALRLFY